MVNSTSSGHRPSPGGDSQHLKGISITLSRNRAYDSTFIQAGPKFRMRAWSAVSGQVLSMYLLADLSVSLYLTHGWATNGSDGGVTRQAIPDIARSPEPRRHSERRWHIIQHQLYNAPLREHR